MGLISKQAVAFSPFTGKTYVIDAADNEVLVFKAASQTPLHVAVGNGPVSLVADRKTGRVYVANATDGSITVIDGFSDKVIAKVEVGPHPYALAFDCQLNRLYVSRTFSDTVAIINGGTLEMTSLQLGSADSLVVDELTHNLFLISYEDPNLRVLNEKTGNIQKVMVGEHLWGIAVSEQNATVYLTRSGSSELIAVDEHAWQKQVRAVGAIPSAVAVDPRGRRVFVANYGDNTVSTFKADGLTKIGLAAVGTRPQSIAVAADGRTAYVASFATGTITRINAENGAASGTFKAGHHPFAISVTNERERLLLADLDAQGWSSASVH